MTEAPAPSNLLSALSTLAQSMAAGIPVQEVLTHLVRAITEVTPVSGAGVTLLDPDLTPRWIAASDATALLGERLQADLREGPCLTAHRSRTPCEVPDLSNEQRFPRFRAAATQAGMRAVFAFPLCAEDIPLGSIDLYRSTAGALTAEEVQTAQTVSDLVASFLLSAQRRTELEGFVQQLRSTWNRDPLTGLPNRLLLMERLEQAFARESRRGDSVAAIFLDLDGFKAVNDRHGHAVGDELLIAMSRRVGAVLRPSDTLARLGGDEFVVVRDAIEDPHTVRELLARIDHCMAEPFDVPGGALELRTSLGSALSGPECRSPQQLLDAADASMYASKRVRHRSDLREPQSLGVPRRSLDAEEDALDWALREPGPSPAEEWWIDGTTRHGGVIASVQWTAATEALVVTEFDADALVVSRCEWARADARRLDAGGRSIERTVTDWDEQVVDRRSVAQTPAPPRSPADLARLLAELVRPEA